jgi:hypothetical protein
LEIYRERHGMTRKRQALAVINFKAGKKVKETWEKVEYPNSN